MTVKQTRWHPKKSTTAAGWDVVSEDSGAIIRYSLPHDQAVQECYWLNRENDKEVMSWDEPKMIPVTEKKRIIVPGGFGE